jgi:hypothetical protein
MSRAEKFACYLPKDMEDDPPAWRDYWTMQVRIRGGEPLGEPHLEEKKTWDGESRWFAVGPAVREVKTERL